MSDPQEWLSQALAEPACWLPGGDVATSDGHQCPDYLYWYVAGRGFFEAQREQRKPATSPFSYKGFPAPAHKVPGEVVEAMRMKGLIDEAQFLSWRRAAKRGARKAS